MEKILEFLRGATGELSSKRLSFIITIFSYVGGSLYFVNKLIAKGQFSDATNLWNSFAVVALVLGGFVSADILQRIFGKKK